MDLDDELLELQSHVDHQHMATEKHDESDSLHGSLEFSSLPNNFATTNEVVLSYNNSEKENNELTLESGKIVAPQRTAKVPQLRIEKVNKNFEAKEKKIESKKPNTSSSSSNISRKNNPLTSSTSAISKLKPKESSSLTKKPNPLLPENQPLPLEKKKVSHFGKEEIEQFMLQQKMKRLKQREEVISAKEVEKKKQKEKLERLEKFIKEQNKLDHETEKKIKIEPKDRFTKKSADEFSPPKRRNISPLKKELDPPHNNLERPSSAPPRSNNSTIKKLDLNVLKQSFIDANKEFLNRLAIDTTSISNSVSSSTKSNQSKMDPPHSFKINNFLTEQSTSMPKHSRYASTETISTDLSSGYAGSRELLSKKTDEYNTNKSPSSSLSSSFNNTSFSPNRHESKLFERVERNDKSKSIQDIKDRLLQKFKSDDSRKASLDLKTRDADKKSIPVKKAISPAVLPNRNYEAFKSKTSNEDNLKPFKVSAADRMNIINSLAKKQLLNEKQKKVSDSSLLKHYSDPIFGESKYMGDSKQRRSIDTADSLRTQIDYDEFLGEEPKKKNPLIEEKLSKPTIEKQHPVLTVGMVNDALKPLLDNTFAQKSTTVSQPTKMTKLGRVHTDYTTPVVPSSVPTFSSSKFTPDQLEERLASTLNILEQTQESRIQLATLENGKTAPITNEFVQIHQQSNNRTARNMSQRLADAVIQTDRRKLTKHLEESFDDTESVMSDASEATSVALEERNKNISKLRDELRKLVEKRERKALKLKQKEEEMKLLQAIKAVKKDIKQLSEEAKKIELMQVGGIPSESQQLLNTNNSNAQGTNANVENVKQRNILLVDDATSPVERLLEQLQHTDPFSSIVTSQEMPVFSKQKMDPSLFTLASDQYYTSPQQSETKSIKLEGTQQNTKSATQNQTVDISNSGLLVKPILSNKDEYESFSDDPLETSIQSISTTVLESKQEEIHSMLDGSFLHEPAEEDEKEDAYGTETIDYEAKQGKVETTQIFPEEEQIRSILQPNNTTKAEEISGAMLDKALEDSVNSVLAIYSSKLEEQNNQSQLLNQSIESFESITQEQSENFDDEFSEEESASEAKPQVSVLEKQVDEVTESIFKSIIDNVFEDFDSISKRSLVPQSFSAKAVSQINVRESVDMTKPTSVTKKEHIDHEELKRRAHAIVKELQVVIPEDAQLQPDSKLQYILDFVANELRQNQLEHVTLNSLLVDSSNAQQIDSTFLDRYQSTVNNRDRMLADVLKHYIEIFNRIAREAAKNYNLKGHIFGRNSYLRNIKETNVSLLEFVQDKFRHSYSCSQNINFQDFALQEITSVPKKFKDIYTSNWQMGEYLERVKSQVVDLIFEDIVSEFAKELQSMER